MPHIGLLIGKQGVKINRLRTDTGASIDIDKATGRTIYI
jgi:polyribonucleotide nucleotidyltransferase